MDGHVHLGRSALGGPPFLLLVFSYITQGIRMLQVRAAVLEERFGWRVIQLAAQRRWFFHPLASARLQPRSGEA